MYLSGCSRIRTCDRWLKRPLLYQLSYTPGCCYTTKVYFNLFWLFEYTNCQPKAGPPWAEAIHPAESQREKVKSQKRGLRHFKIKSVFCIDKTRSHCTKKRYKSQPCYISEKAILKQKNRADRRPRLALSMSAVYFEICNRVNKIKTPPERSKQCCCLGLRSGGCCGLASVSPVPLWQCFGRGGRC